uniref:Putative monolaris n=1 Tax=Rhipicephalus pulchellus TaxID=72859 RepID=L7MC07_RHIPC
MMTLLLRSFYSGIFACQDMDKTAFLLLLVLSNIVPLLALGSMAQRRPRKIQQARAQARALVQALTANQKPPFQPGFKVPALTCDGRTSNMCHYPPMCICPHRAAAEHEYMDPLNNWFYDKKTGKCQKTTSQGGCNIFEDEHLCEHYCMGIRREDK